MEESNKGVSTYTEKPTVILLGFATMDSRWQVSTVGAAFRGRFRLNDRSFSEAI
jgi:hypothetical protein